MESGSNREFHSLSIRIHVGVANMMRMTKSEGYVSHVISDELSLLSILMEQESICMYMYLSDLMIL